MVFLFSTLFAFFFSFSLSATAEDKKDEIEHERSSSVTTLIHNVTPIGDENNEVEEEMASLATTSASSSSSARQSVTAGTVRSGKDEVEEEMASLATTSASSSSSAARQSVTADLVKIGAYLITDTSLPPASYADIKRPGVTVYREKNWTNKVLRRFFRDHPKINWLIVTELPEVTKFFEILYGSLNNFVELDIESYNPFVTRRDFTQAYAHKFLQKYRDLKSLWVSTEQARILEGKLTYVQAKKISVEVFKEIYLSDNHAHTISCISSYLTLGKLITEHHITNQAADDGLVIRIKPIPRRPISYVSYEMKPYDWVGIGVFVTVSVTTIGIPVLVLSLPVYALGFSAYFIYKTAESIYSFPFTIKTVANGLFTRLCKRKDK